MITNPLLFPMQADHITLHSHNLLSFSFLLIAKLHKDFGRCVQVLFEGCLDQLCGNLGVLRDEPKQAAAKETREYQESSISHILQMLSFL